MDDFAISRAEQKLALIKGRSCDKYDYLISVACGAAAGLIDVFLVDAPGNKSILQSWSDTQIDHLVERFAKLNGWSGKGIDSAIQWLEGSLPINYDQRYGADVNGAFAMSTRNHHLKSLAHSPDPIGLFFSILDQFQGKASFIADGQLIRFDTETLELKGNTFHAKLFCGFCNWIGHIMSDIAGSHTTRSGDGRGSGIAIPFYELFLFLDVGDFQIDSERRTLADVMIRTFENGYDVRFGIAASLPVLLTDLFIRAIWAIKQHYYHHEAWKNCIPNDTHADLRCMLIVGNCTLCLFDGAGALIRSGGNPVSFILHLNLIAWFKLVLMIFKEILIRYDFTYEDLKAHIQYVNQVLDDYLTRLRHIDYVTYKAELDSLHSIQAILEDNHAGTEQIYRYLSDHGVKMQFHSFEEFDQKMQDDNFILEI